MAVSDMSETDRRPTPTSTLYATCAPIAAASRPVARYAAPNTAPVQTCWTARRPCRPTCPAANRSVLTTRAPARPIGATRNPSAMARHTASSWAALKVTASVRARSRARGTVASAAGEIRLRASVAKRITPAPIPSGTAVAR